MSAHNSSIAIFPSLPTLWSQEGDGARRFPCKFSIPGLGFQDAPKKGVQQMRTAPGSASTDPIKAPFLWHQSREFQPEFVIFLLLLLDKMRVKPNLHSKIFSWQQEHIRVQQPCKKAPPLSHYYTCRKEIKLNQGIKTAERDDCSPETLICHLQTAFANSFLPRTFPQ